MNKSEMQKREIPKCFKNDYFRGLSKYGINSLSVRFILNPDFIILLIHGTPLHPKHYRVLMFCHMKAY